MASEFDLINKYFRSSDLPDDVTLGVGDDAALLNVPEGEQLVVTVDTLLSGVHFPVHTSPIDIGHKALAVNLSDLAAMGADPRWLTLALSIPEADEAWIQGFAEGFNRLARQHGVSLVGGDTTRGPLSITVQAMGWVNNGMALLRSTATAGDAIYISGSIGDAGLALEMLKDQGADPPLDVLNRLNRPLPRVELGLALHSMANACIDVSDGVIADLGHILESSEVGADLLLADIPYSDAVGEWIDAGNNSVLPLSWGDDYELLFTASPDYEEELQQLSEKLELPITRIGKITDQAGLRIRSAEGEIINVAEAGYDHFGNQS
jgi:thiamine-monophosphate kinase